MTDKNMKWTVYKSAPFWNQKAGGPDNDGSLTVMLDAKCDHIGMTGHFTDSSLSFITSFI